MVQLLSPDFISKDYVSSIGVILQVTGHLAPLKEVLAKEHAQSNDESRLSEKLSSKPAGSLIVQEFVSKQLLLNGRTFDVGVFVLMTSVYPLRLYIYSDDVAVKVNKELFPKEGVLGQADRRKFVISDETNSEHPF
jgi:hypothetical protein